jgi:homoserine dehydrogenase
MNKQNPVLKVGIAGLGVVGGEVARQLMGRADALAAAAECTLRLVAVAARDRARDRGFDSSGLIWVDNAPDMAAIDEIDIIVEMIGGSEGIALDLVKAALAAGKHVVTANKAMLAHHGTMLAQLAEDNHVGLLFEASIAGGIPAVKTLREGLIGNRITRVSGILNGTCNYILSRMETTGEAFEDVLADAQKLGYAEAEPSFDVDGIDAAHKLTILGAIAFSQTPDFNAVSIKGIRDVAAVDFTYANKLGYRIKLVGVAEPGQAPRMETCLLPLNSQLAKVNGVLNAVEIHGTPIGSVLSIGPGAGAGATASAVLADLIDIGQGRVTHPFGRPIAELADGSAVERKPGEDTPYYARLMVVDQSGVLADVTRVLQQHEISVETLLQQGRSPDNVVPLVLTTHETSSAALQSALAEIEMLDCVKAKPVAMPILSDDLEG